MPNQKERRKKDGVNKTKKLQAMRKKQGSNSSESGDSTRKRRNAG